MEQEIADLVSDREKFNAFVYTGVGNAVTELEKRQAHTEHPTHNVPDVLKDKKAAVLFRQIATPNFEVRRFVSLVDGLEGFTPVFFEYLQDKYTDNNELKYYWGNLPFYSGKGKKGGDKISYLKVIDFNSSRGKKIGEVETLWKEDLTRFHRALFDRSYKQKKGGAVFFDASEWFSNSGGKASDYYRKFLELFISDGILFENFMLSEEEFSFTKEVFLPAFMKIFQETGKKPLIVALEPTEIESDLFWHCHPEETREFVDNKIKEAQQTPL